MTAAADIATEAAELVSGSRQESYGSPLDCHRRIALVWNGILAAAGHDIQLDAHMVATLLEGMKIARRFGGSYSRDSYTDAAGYAAIAGSIRAAA